MSDSLWPHGLYSPRNSPAQNTGEGSLPLLQGISPTQALSPGLLHCRQIFHQLSHKGSPRGLEWVAYPFSRGSSWPRNWTGVSCIAGGFFTNWAIREYKKTRSNSKNRKVGESEILYLQMILKIGQNIMLQKSFFTFAFMVCFYEIFFAKSEEGICGKVWKREIKWSRKGNERAAMQDYKSNFESMFKDE